MCIAQFGLAQVTIHYHGPGALVADAGCILEALTEYIAPHNHIMPLDLGAKGRYALTQSFVMHANSHAIPAVRLVETSRPTRVVFAFYDTAPCMGACLVLKLCYRTELSWITSPLSERIILVKLSSPLKRRRLLIAHQDMILSNSSLVPRARWV